MTSKAVQDLYKCIVGQVLNGVADMVEGMLNSIVDNVANFADCMVDQFVGGILNGVIDEFAGMMTGFWVVCQDINILLN